MVEALVALVIAAITLTLLTTASWGLKLANDGRNTSLETDATDWLTARRALHAWASGMSATSAANTSASLLGSSTTARIAVHTGAAHPAGAFVGELRVEQTKAGEFSLLARRYDNTLDVRAADASSRDTLIARAREPMRLIYLMQRPDNPGARWTYEYSGQSLPKAIGLEVGGTRQLTAKVQPTRSAACVAQFGAASMDNEGCALR